MSGKRKVEVFVAGCPLCDETVELVKKLACPGCDVTIYNLQKKGWIRQGNMVLTQFQLWLLMERFLIAA